jgi:hypothetical protein
MMTINIKIIKNIKFSYKRIHVTFGMVDCLRNKALNIDQTTNKIGRNTLNMIMFLHFQTIHKIFTIVAMMRLCNLGLQPLLHVSRSVSTLER